MEIIAYEHFGWDRHLNDVKNKSRAIKVTFAYNIVIAEAECFSKLSLLWFSRRLVGRASSGAFRTYYRALMALMTIISLLIVSFLIVSVVECRYVSTHSTLCKRTIYVRIRELIFHRPLKAAWDLNRASYPYTCINQKGFQLSISIIGTATDFLATVVPAFIVARLQMPLQQKIGVASIFLVGVTVNIASVLRIIYAQNQVGSMDPTWYIYQPVIACDFELGLGQICVNVPTLRPLILQGINRIKNTRRSYATALDFNKSDLMKSYNSRGYYGGIRESEKLGSHLQSQEVEEYNQNKAFAIKHDPDAMHDCENLNGIKVVHTVELDTLGSTLENGSDERLKDSKNGSSEEVSD